MKGSIFNSDNLPLHFLYKRTYVCMSIKKISHDHTLNPMSGSIRTGIYRFLEFYLNFRTDRQLGQQQQLGFIVYQTIRIHWKKKSSVISLITVQFEVVFSKTFVNPTYTNRMPSLRLVYLHVYFQNKEVASIQLLVSGENESMKWPLMILMYFCTEKKVARSNARLTQGKKNKIEQLFMASFMDEGQQTHE